MRTAEATIVAKNTDGHTVIRVRRSPRDELLYARRYGEHDDLKVGDKIQVYRIPNNPYRVRVTE